MWLGATRLGYGRVLVSGKMRSAHRVAYELAIGPIPDGLTIDHLCRNPGCVNPIHLEPVTIRVNILRGSMPAADNARKTHCKNGHPFEGDNLSVLSAGRRRRCRTCYNAHSRARWAARGVA
jgi:hypothetical protein